MCFTRFTKIGIDVSSILNVREVLKGRVEPTEYATYQRLDNSAHSPYQLKKDFQNKLLLETRNARWFLVLTSQARDRY